MPIKTFAIGQPDMAGAIAQGNRNALAEAQMASTAQQMQHRNVMAPIEQQQAQANLSATQLKSDADRQALLGKVVASATDQASWAAGRNTLINHGMPKESLPEGFDPKIQRAILDNLTGKAPTEQYGEIQPIKGMPGYSGQRSETTGKYANIEETSIPQQAAKIDPLAPWKDVKDPKKIDEARMRFGAMADKKAAKMTEEADQSAATINDLNRFIHLNATNRTGPEYNIFGVGTVLGGARGIVDPEFQEMKSIMDKLTPAMRQGMPGAASDRDVAMFRGATVGVGKQREANENIATGLIAARQNKIDKAGFYSNYVAERGHDRGSEKEWKEYLNANPIFDHKAGKGSYALNQDRMSYDEWKDGSLAFTAEKHGLTIQQVREKLAGGQ